MHEKFAAELIGRMALQLRAEVAAHMAVPLDIKLHLERLRLAELVRGAARQRQEQPAA